MRRLHSAVLCLVLGSFVQTAYAQCTRYVIDELETPPAVYTYGLGRGLDHEADTAFVGSPFQQGGGVVEWFARTESGWQFVELISPPTGHDDDHFGLCVAMQGDLLVVGQPGWNGGGIERGRVVIFVRSGEHWLHDRTLDSPLLQDGIRFGQSVAIHGTRLAVGTGRPNEGRVFLFESDGEAWVLSTTLQPTAPWIGSWFGSPLALTDDVVAVSATSYADHDGAVYCFRDTGTGWLESRIDPPIPGLFGHFGHAIDAEGDRVAIGEPLHPHPAGGSTAGVAYVCQWNGSDWQALMSAAGELGDRMGSSVELRGDECFVGIARPASEQRPTVDEYRIASPHGRRLASYRPIGGSATYEFGGTTSLDGDTLIVGSPSEYVVFSDLHVFSTFGALPFRRGDCSGDDAVDVADAIHISNYLFFGAAVDCEPTCDANDDLAIDVSDMIYLLSFLFIDGDEPPTPFLSCGDTASDETVLLPRLSLNAKRDDPQRIVTLWWLAISRRLRLSPVSREFRDLGALVFKHLDDLRRLRQLRKQFRELLR